jgi:hypothetical protein
MKDVSIFVSFVKVLQKTRPKIQWLAPKKKKKLNYKSFYYKHDIWMENLPKSLKVENCRLWAILFSSL